MKIETIDDVLPFIEGREDFIVAKREGYTIIDYRVSMEDSFAHPMRLECRGIKFGPDGRVIGRPFHKFFNIGEKEHTQPHLIDLKRPHVIMDKLDGSMIHPALVEGELKLMTRMGHTDVARAAERLLTPAVVDALNREMAAGHTPILEYTAPDNRIVLRYEEPKLTLLAVRGMVEGTYRAQPQVEELARAMGLSAVPVIESTYADTFAFINWVRALMGREGFVLRFADGLWVKAKAEDYVLKHKSKEMISLEKNALALILSNGVDDVLPLLNDADRKDLVRYVQDVGAGFKASVNRIEEIVRSGAHLDQKAFATQHLKGAPSLIRSLAFAVRGGKPAADAVREVILKNTHTSTQVDKVRELFAARYGVNARMEPG